MRECGSGEEPEARAKGETPRQETRSEAKAERREAGTLSESEAGKRPPEAKSGKRIGINCHVLLKRSLYRFEGLKAKGWPEGGGSCRKLFQMGD